MTMKLELQKSFLQVNQSMQSNSDILREVVDSSRVQYLHEKLMSGLMSDIDMHAGINSAANVMRLKSDLGGHLLNTHEADSIFQRQKINHSFHPRLNDPRRDLARTLLSLDPESNSNLPSSCNNDHNEFHSSLPHLRTVPASAYQPLFVNQTLHSNSGSLPYPTVAGSPLSHYGLLKSVQGIPDYGYGVNPQQYPMNNAAGYPSGGSSFMFVPGMALALLPQTNEAGEHGASNRMQWPYEAQQMNYSATSGHHLQQQQHEQPVTSNGNWLPHGDVRRSADREAITGYLATLGLYSERGCQIHNQPTPMTSNENDVKEMRNCYDLPPSNPMQCLGEAAVRILKGEQQQQQQKEKWQTSKTSTASLASKRKTKHDKICTVCGKGYARTFTLRNHMRIHTGEKPYSCRVCQRTFNQLGTMEIHMRTHTGERPYHCALCQKKFGHSYALKTHMRTHTGEKPYSCQVCSKSFADGSTLYKHKRTHNGEKPFACKFCHRRFSQSGNMHRHMTKTHHNEAVNL